MKTTENEPHPDISEWLSESSASDDGRFKSWSTLGEKTDGEIAPFAITHDREFMMDGDEVTQDYNFLTYLFGNQKNPTQARAYVDEIWEVGVIPPEGKSVVPKGVMHYLKKRFRRITVLGEQGYQTVWQK